VEGLERVKFIEHVDGFAGHNPKQTTASFELKIQVTQAFEQKVIMLSRSIGAAPQRGLDDVEAQDRALTERLTQCCVVIEPQITFKPHNAVTHTGASGLSTAMSRRL
jgi:hypothetical protein